MTYISAASRAILKLVYRFGIPNSDPQTLKSVDYCCKLSSPFVVAKPWAMFWACSECKIAKIFWSIPKSFEIIVWVWYNNRTIYICIYTIGVYLIIGVLLNYILEYANVLNQVSSKATVFIYRYTHTHTHTKTTNQPSCMLLFVKQVLSFSKIVCKECTCILPLAPFQYLLQQHV